MTYPSDLVSADELYANISEATFTQHVIAAGRERAYKTYHTLGQNSYAKVTSNGFPDIVFSKKGRLIFAELKTLKAYKTKNHGMTDDQLDWRDDLLSVGAEWYCWNPTQWDEMIEVLDA